jgi:hypothetical protein
MYEKDTNNMYEITSRNQAKLMNLPHYFTGQPCKKGHLDRRTVKWGNCLSCSNEFTQEWRKNNIEKSKQMSREHSKKAYRTSWKRRLSTLLHGASSRFGGTRGKSHEISITIEDLLQQLSKQNYKDFYTGRNLSLATNDLFNSPSIDRIDSSKGYHKGNVVITTGVVNRAKNDLSVKEFIELCKTIHEYSLK